jgi:hypothetical protein
MHFNPVQAANYSQVIAHLFVTVKRRRSRYVGDNLFVVLSLEAVEALCLFLKSVWRCEHDAKYLFPVKTSGQTFGVGYCPARLQVDGLNYQNLWDILWQQWQFSVSMVFTNVTLELALHSISLVLPTWQSKRKDRVHWNSKEGKLYMGPNKITLFYR